MVAPGRADIYNEDDGGSHRVRAGCDYSAAGAFIELVHLEQIAKGGMLAESSKWLEDHLPGYRRLARLPRQILRISPFDGDSQPSRVELFSPWSKRPTLPFPHPGNYREPIRILETYFWGADELSGPGKHNRYLEVLGFSPILVSRDPGMIRAITTETGDKPGQFDRDTLPSTGIARSTGTDTLLYANGSSWKRQRKIAASPFGKSTLFQPERFQEFAEAFRHTVSERLNALKQHLHDLGQQRTSIRLELEIKAVMLELLTNKFFGADVSYELLRNRYVPAVERVIEFIVRDTVLNRLGIPVVRLPRFTQTIAQARADHACFDELTDIALSMRGTGMGLWSQFKSDVPNAALRSNVKVFLAGALEATTSYACWAITHLAQNQTAQARVFDEVKDVLDYSPDNLNRAKYLGHVLDETLRLTPALYFLPRRATVDTWVEAADGRKMLIPRGTHILLDIWHANRHEDHWGTSRTGYPALAFAPERWENMEADGRASKDILHFGFGHGPRVCPGQHLGQLEVGLVVGAFVKLFHFSAESADCAPKVGVTTKPSDETLVELELR